MAIQFDEQGEQKPKEPVAGQRGRIEFDDAFFPGAGAPSTPAAPSRTEYDVAGIGKSAGIAGTAATVLPRVLGAVPYAPAKALGAALGTAGPFTRAVSGAVAGGGSEAVGQTAELLGATPQVSELARFLPAPLQAAAERGTAYVSGRLGGGLRYLQRLGEPGARSAQTQAAVRQLQGTDIGATETVAGALRQEAAAREAMIPGIESSATAQQQAAQQAAASAGARLPRVGMEATRATEQRQAEALARRERGAGLLGRVEERTAAGQQVAQELRSRVGQPRSATDIGGELRQRIVSNKEGEIARRSANYQQDLAARDAVVQQRVSAGENITDLPEYKAVIDDLRSKLLIGKQPAERKLADVTEAGVESALRRIYDSVTPRRVQTQIGTDPVGQPIMETREFKPSFQALDEVRRKMGDVAFGKEVEGYEGISRNIAKDMYEKLSDLQRKFAGEAQDVLQSRYEEASTLLSRFKGAAGKRATAVDKYNDAEFVTDPARLPTTYFSSPTGVKNLLELTGDRQLVEKAAREFSATQLANMNANEVSNWIRKSDWLREVPQLQADVARYQAALARAESTAARGAETATGLRRRMAREATAAESRIGELEAGAKGERKALRGEITEQTKRAEEIGKVTANRVEEIRKEAAMIAGDPRPGERMERLILSSQAPAELRVVGQFISQNPQAMQAFPNAVRITIANRVSPTNMLYEWQQNVKPLLEGSGLIPARQLAAIESDIQRVAQTLQPAQRITWLQNTIGKALAIGAGRGGMAFSDAMGI